MKKQTLTIVIITIVFSLNALWAQSIGQSLNFKKFDYLEGSALGLPTGNTNFTIEAWVKVPSSTLGKPYGSAVVSLGDFYSGKKFGRFSLIIAPNGRIAFHGNKTKHYTNTTIDFDKWTHIAVTYNNTNGDMIFYKNGQRIDISNVIPKGSLDITYNNFFYLGVEIPKQAKDFVFPFVGTIDEVRIWNISRSDTDILNNHKKIISNNSLGLVAYFNFNQGVAKGNNTSENSVYDLTIGNSASLANFTRTGKVSNFISDSPIDETVIGYISNNGQECIEPSNNLMHGQTFKVNEDSKLISITVKRCPDIGNLDNLYLYEVTNNGLSRTPIATRGIPIHHVDTSTGELVNEISFVPLPSQNIPNITLDKTKTYAFVFQYRGNALAEVLGNKNVPHGGGYTNGSAFTYNHNNLSNPVNDIPITFIPNMDLWFEVEYEKL